MKQKDKYTGMDMLENDYYVQMEKSSGLRYIGTSRVWASKTNQKPETSSHKSMQY